MQSFDVFYQRLQSGGHWFDDPTYGYVWQPDAAASDANWRPYSDGHWVYTDQGWTGFPTKTSAGQRTIMVDGHGELTVDGSGFRVANGRQPGSPGEKAAITWAGLH